MKAQTTQVTKGERIAFESGEYSDRSVCGFYEALSTFDLATLLAAFNAEHPAEDDWRDDGPHQFLSYLILKGLLAPLTYRSVHLGSYGRLEL